LEPWNLFARDNISRLGGIDLVQVLLLLVVLIASLSVHEAAHAFAADRLGDPTARQLGRLSINPAVHVDPIGTLLFPLIAFMTNVPLIGWAKPVPVDPRYLKHPKRDFAIIAAAGPASNLVMATLAAMVLAVIPGPAPGDIAGRAVLRPLHQLLDLFVYLNVLLAVFNMIPVPPLDGGNVMLGLLPPNLAAGYSQLRQYGFVILYVLMFTGAASAFITPPTRFMMRLLIP